MNLYSVEPDAFDDDDVAVASVFAAHAAVALAGATQEAQLEAKADSRDVIGVAKGIIMAGQRFRRRGLHDPPSGLAADETSSFESRLLRIT